MEYIKKHKLTAFIILVYIIIVGFAYFIFKLFIGSSGLPVYGDRLDGIEDVPITEEQKDKIVEALTKDSYVLKVTRPYLNGKVLKVVITGADASTLDGAKNLAPQFLGVLDKDQRAFYDIEVFITKRYNCTLEATGKMDEDGFFVGDVTVKFKSDLSKSDLSVEYGLSKTNEVNYNKEQTIKITEDGEHIIYGFTKDKISGSTCSIKVVRKTSDAVAKETTIDTVSVDRNFPTIGYMKAGSNSFVWAKTS